MKKTALITGITGQDGSYLAELLLKKKYKVYGIVRRTSTERFERIEHIKDKLTIIPGDLLDTISLNAAIDTIKPDEVYNLAAQSFIPTSWNQPILTSNITALGVTRLLSAIHQYSPKTKFYQASSSEMFGKVQEIPQTEKTPFYPRSPYGVAKVYGHYITVNYRESYNLFACSGILFNHESPRRGIEFVTRKITHAVARIKLGLQKKLLLGNLDAKRDFGHSIDYVRAMWLMLQQKKPDDYVIASGETYSIKEVVKFCFDYVDLDWREYVKQDKRLIRPAEVNLLIGDASKAKKHLKWEPHYSFEELLTEMIESDLEGLKKCQKS